MRLSPEIALHPDRLGVIFAELPLRNISVIALQLLLGLELSAKVRELAFAALAMLAWAIFPAIDGTLRAPPDVLPHAAIEFIFGFCAFGHRVLECCADGRERALTPEGRTANRVFRRQMAEVRALLCKAWALPTGGSHGADAERGRRGCVIAGKARYEMRAPLRTPDWQAVERPAPNVKPHAIRG